MPKLNRDGVGIYYEVHGEGLPLILSHGYSATSQCGRADRGASGMHKLVIWDMRGHGQSDYPDDPGGLQRRATVDDMAAILDAVGADRRSSAGCRSAGTCRWRSSRIRSACGAAHHRHRARLQEGRGARGLEQDARNGRAFRREGLAALAVAERRGASARIATPGLLGGARHADPARRRVIESLPKSLCRRWWSWARRTSRSSRPPTTWRQKFRARKKVVIPNAGHAANIDQPAAFNEAVLAFLDRPRRPASRRGRRHDATLSQHRCCWLRPASPRSGARTAADRRPLSAALHRNALQQRAAGLSA